MRFAVLGIALLSAGCGPKLNTYRLVHQVLVPPNVKGPEVARRTLVAQGVAVGSGKCDPGGAVGVNARKRTLRVTVDGEALRAQSQAGWLADWSIREEAGGCVASGQASRLAERVVQSVPLDSDTAYRLLFPNGARSGYVELGPENVLEVRRAIMRPGQENADPIGEIQGVSGDGTKVTVALKVSESVVGFETAWYGIRVDGAGVVRFLPLSAERTIDRKITQEAAPDVEYMRLQGQARYLRLFYKADDNGVTSLIIGGLTRPELDTRTKAVAANSAVCEQQGGMCMTLPKKVGVNPLLVVPVNGRDVRVLLGATVRSAIQAAGERAPESIVSKLAVTKLYAGQPRKVEFDRHAEDILNLKLVGGETISWQ